MPTWKVKPPILGVEAEKSQGRDSLLDEQDIFGSAAERRSSALWMGRYTEHEVLHALEKSGFLPALKQKGLSNVVVQIEPIDPFLQSLKLYHQHHHPSDLLAEFRLRNARLPLARRDSPESGSPTINALAIEWMLLQNPYAEFNESKPQLPGQNHPGLGQAKTILKLLVHLAKALELEAVANFPQYFHNAFLYRHNFKFYDPEREGLLYALARDLASLSLSEAAWAIDLGFVRYRESGAVFQWQSDLALLGLTAELKEYFTSNQYAQIRQRALESNTFVIDAEGFRRHLRDQSLSSPASDSHHSPRKSASAVPNPPEGRMEHRSIYQLFREVCHANPDKVAYTYKKNGEWHPVTWSETETACNQVSKSLIALGVKKGDRVDILSQSRLEWVLCDFAGANCGVVTVGIYPSNLAEDCAYIIEHSQAEVIFVENSDQLQKVLSTRNVTPRIRNIIIYEGASDSRNCVMSWNDFLQLGTRITDQELERRANDLRPDDLLALVYTSGTTGVPKAAMITHGNLLFTSDSACQSLYLRDDFVTLLFLPLAHVFARLVIYFCLRTAITIAFAESIEKVPDNLREVRPHFIASVPRIFEKVYTKILTGVQQAGGIKEKLFNWALGVGRQVSQLQQSKKPIPQGLAMKHALANKLVFHKIHAAFGGRLVWAVSGSAPLNKSIAEFFHACGVLILEGIGMTENTSFSNVNRYDHNKFGSVGPVGPGIEMKLGEDGEILYRGPNVMKGYFRNPQATAETIDPEGWLHTGDIGEIDEEGFLRVTDRKKDLIITSGGKNVAPQRIERILRTSPYISQVVAIGDKRKFITALVSLNPEHVEPWAKEHGIEFKSPDELAHHPRVQELIDKEVLEKNKQLASFESVKKVRIVPKDFSIQAGELTPTLKIKRNVVTEKYAGLLEEMYGE